MNCRQPRSTIHWLVVNSEFEKPTKWSSLIFRKFKQIDHAKVNRTSAGLDRHTKFPRAQPKPIRFTLPRPSFASALNSGQTRAPFCRNPPPFLSTSFFSWKEFGTGNANTYFIYSINAGFCYSVFSEGSTSTAYVIYLPSLVLLLTTEKVKET